MCYNVALPIVLNTVQYEDEDAEQEEMAERNSSHEIRREDKKHGTLRVTRSSNIAEGWHHGFHSLMGCSNPTIRIFLDFLKKEQNLTDVKITQHLMRRSPSPSSEKVV
ncbi:hypothetical protein ACHWQZ_G015232 [Mnemiopsis leidyi]